MSNEHYLRRRTAARARMMRRRRITLGVAGGLILALLVTVGAAWAVSALKQPTAEGPTPGETKPVQKPVSETPPTPKTEPQPEAPEQTNELPEYSDPESIHFVVNKQRPIEPIDWQPYDLVQPNVPNSSGHPVRSVAAAALEEMYAAANGAGLHFTITSGFRSYAMQMGLFDSYAQRDGVDAAELYSARAGFSEHQTGLAVDLDDESGCAFLSCFGETATGQWLRHNAHHYGFILRYDDGEQGTVGYMYEPWHFRYIGVDVATAMYDQGTKNLEDYFGLPAAPTY